MFEQANSLSPLLATITTPAKLPIPTPHQLLRRDDVFTTYPDVYATCGYKDGDVEHPYTCGADGSCLCQTRSGVMGSCFPDATSDSFCDFPTACKSGTLSGVQTTSGGSTTYEITCPASAPFCQRLTWTNSKQSDNPTWSAWQCGSKSTSQELSWANGSPTATSSKTKTSSKSKSTGETSSNTSGSSTSSSTSLPAGISESPSSSKLPAAAIGGIVGGIAVFLIIAISIAVWVIHHRRSKQENLKRLSAMDEGKGFLAPNPTPSPQPSPYLAASTPPVYTAEPSAFGLAASPNMNQGWNQTSGASELPATTADSNRYTQLSELSAQTSIPETRR